MDRKRRWTIGSGQTLTVLAALAVFCVTAAAAASGAEPVTLGYLGITDLESNMTIKILKSGGRPEIAFRSEPVIQGVDPQGPSHGKLKVGDTVVSVDGLLITTEEGAGLFVDPPPGKPIELTVRRGRGTETVSIVPETISLDDPSALFGLTLPPEPPNPLSDIQLPGVPPLPDIDLPSPFYPPEPEFPYLPHVWLGFGLRCSIEGMEEEGNLRFTRPPEVLGVQPASAADKAGLRAKDVLTHVDGLALDTLEGTRRFAEIRPGDEITWTVLRGKERLSVNMVAEPTPGLLPPGPVEPPTPPRGGEMADLRYLGALENTAVEVHSPSRESVRVKEGAGEIVIYVGECVVVVRRIQVEGEKKDGD